MKIRVINRKMLLIYAALIFIKLEAGSAPIKNPRNPELPKVSLNEKRNEFTYPVIIDFVLDKRIKGNMMLKSDIITVPVPGKKSVRQLQIKEISTIEFVKWKGSEYREKSYLFKPSRIKITLNDSSFIIVNGNISSLDRITFRDNNRSETRTVFPVFYDYRKGGKWLNSHEESIDYPDNNPHVNTLVKIEFLHSSSRDILTEEIMRMIKKSR